jgi:AGCS family alanine or glycine:cation symporter
VGTGNIAGVAGAIAIGGPGSIFWMWVCGILGMVTKYAEATLAVRYRQKNEKGEFVGGPMYMITHGMGKKWRWLAYVYCFFGVVACFGVGNATQVNAVLGGVEAIVGDLSLSQRFFLGCLLALMICVLLLGGAQRIGRAAEALVPFAAISYLLLGIFVLIFRRDQIGNAFSLIFEGACDPAAVTGGVVGSYFKSLRVGAARGVFTNEAGMGTASIAHAGAQVEHPIQQGLMGIMEVFIDTIVICTMTALVILCSGVSIPYGSDVGIALTVDAFSAVCGAWVSGVIAVALLLFAVATILGWGLYGVRCAQFLFGENVWKKFVPLQGIAVVLGAILGTGTLWLFSEIVNGLMVIPNLTVLACLTPELIRLQKDRIP